MRDGLLRRLDQLVDDVFGRGSVGVAHAEVDDVFAAAACGNLHLPRDVEDIRRKALNAAELFHGNKFTGNRDRKAVNNSVHSFRLSLALF